MNHCYYIYLLFVLLFIYLFNFYLIFYNTKQFVLIIFLFLFSYFGGVFLKPVVQQTNVNVIALSCAYRAFRRGVVLKSDQKIIITVYQLLCFSAYLLLPNLYRFLVRFNLHFVHFCKSNLFGSVSRESL